MFDTRIAAQDIKEGQLVASLPDGRIVPAAGSAGHMKIVPAPGQANRKKDHEANRIRKQATRRAQHNHYLYRKHLGLLGEGRISRRSHGAHAEPTRSILTEPLKVVKVKISWWRNLLGIIYCWIMGIQPKKA